MQSQTVPGVLTMPINQPSGQALAKGRLGRRGQSSTGNANGIERNRVLSLGALMGYLVSSVPLASAVR